MMPCHAVTGTAIVSACTPLQRDIISKQRYKRKQFQATRGQAMQGMGIDSQGTKRHTPGTLDSRLHSHTTYLGDTHMDR